MDESRGSISRRRVVAGAAWTAPVVVLATAAPALAASAPAAVTTVVSGNLASGSLRVLVTFTNANTGATGVTPFTVTIVPTPGLGGTVAATAPTIGQNQPGFVYASTAEPPTGGRSFTFTSAAGIPGAPSATDVQQSIFVFTVTVTGSTSDTGTLSTAATPSAGTVSPGNGFYN